MDKIKCLILSSTEDDFDTSWEILSVLRDKLQSIDEDVLIDGFYEALNFLLINGYVKVYQGYKFDGDETELIEFKLTKEFILSHKDDWKNIEYKGIDYRFYITEEGRNKLLTECNSDFFKTQ